MGELLERVGHKPAAALETLGCKVNQYESAHLLSLLAGEGFRIVPFQETADLYVVHSCAVTARAAYQTRQLLRRARRRNPQAQIVVAGCGAQLEPDRFEAEGLATHILGNPEKHDLPEFLSQPASLARPLKAVSNPRLCSTLQALPVQGMGKGRSRAYLRIQDGCDAFCTYCVVPYTRGKSRSLHGEEVRRQMSRFVEAGFHEVVLTGIHLGCWGKDLQPASDLSSLIVSLTEGQEGWGRIRLSSLEPMEITPSLLSVLRANPSICSHFHVPLQHGDEAILARMRRPYSPGHYAEVLFELRRLFPRASIGADVMVGFPGETEREFQNTYSLIEVLPLTYLHVFPFSPRPGTPAAEWKDRPRGRDVQRRAKVLWGLGGRKKKAFSESFLGQKLQVLVETPLGGGWWQGTSDNYLKVRFYSPTPLAQGCLVWVSCERPEEDGLSGKLFEGGLNLL